MSSPCFQDVRVGGGTLSTEKQRERGGGILPTLSIEARGTGMGVWAMDNFEAEGHGVVATEGDGVMVR